MPRKLSDFWDFKGSDTIEGRGPNSGEEFCELYDFDPEDFSDLITQCMSVFVAGGAQQFETIIGWIIGFAYMAGRNDGNNA